MKSLILSIIFIFFQFLPAFAGQQLLLGQLARNNAGGGALATETLDPSADGYMANQWTLVGGTGYHYDDMGDDSDSTYCETATYNSVEAYEFANTSASSGKTISAVRVYVRAKQSVEQIGIRVFVYPSGDTYRYQDIGVIGTSYGNYYYEWTTNPADSQPWESADIDAMTAGYRSNTDSIATLDVSECWVEVDYTP